MLALVDCNSCYASCEQIYRPDLRGQPIVVLSNNDGCIVTRNKEAKALNIPDLLPYFKIKSYLEQNNVHVFSSNYELYGDASARIMSLLSGYASEIEIYSIDEAFLELPIMLPCDYRQHGELIKSECWKQQRMPVCVGIAQTKTLAKLANHIAKKSNKLDGVCVIDDVEKWGKVFSKLRVNKVWGIGSRIAKRLELMGVYSVGQFMEQPSKRLRSEFGVVVERVHSELHGKACIDLEVQPPPKKEIFCSRSFSHKITSKALLQESIANYAVRASEKLRAQGSMTRRVYVIAQSSRFKDNYYKNSLSAPLLYPTNDSRVITSIAKRLVDQVYVEGVAFAKAGVGLLDLSSPECSQPDLFDHGQSLESTKLMATFDSVNRRYGGGSVFIASQGIRRPWAMARAMKSPAYTTRMSDIPLIKI